MIRSKNINIKNSKITLSVSCGYSIRVKKETVDLYSAYKLLNTIKQYRYSGAERLGDRAELTRHFIHCPFCGKEIPAYPHYLYNNTQAAPKRSASELYEWAGLQTSLFGDSPTALYLQKPVSSVKKYICKKCGRLSEHSDKEIEVSIENDKSHICVERKISNIQDITQMKWLSSVTLTNLLELCERIVFDFKSGITYIQLISKSGEILHSLDLTDGDIMTDCSVLTALISENISVKRKIKSFFQQHWMSPIPFTLKNISIFEFILMTRFMDFPRSFYYAIPFAKNSNKTEKSFAYVTDKIHTSADAVEFLMRSEMPHTKSINRSFFEDPGLLFYLNECKTLFDIIKDINLFCALMRSYNAFTILSMLHAYSGIAIFYTDYCNVKGAKSLCRHLAEEVLSVDMRAIKYCALSMYERSNEQKRWKDDRNYFKEDVLYAPPFFIPEFSTPMRSVPESIPDCAIDGFIFKWLRTKRDYQNAGKRLNNCLINWRSGDDPVVAIHMNNDIIAAMEIGGKKVCQALRSHNDPIDEETTLFLAIQKWCGRNNVVWEHEDE